MTIYRYFWNLSIYRSSDIFQPNFGEFGEYLVAQSDQLGVQAHMVIIFIDYGYGHKSDQIEDSSWLGITANR
jgi:hypothetical protein